MNEPCKSFFNLGYSLPKCLNCSYCILKNTHYVCLSLPQDLNAPVAVNMLYGDPMLQVERTEQLLGLLEKNNHKGVVFIATKGNYQIFNKREYDLDLHIAFSTFGIDSPLDGGSMQQFKSNLVSSLTDTYSHSIEYRPIIKGVNDNILPVLNLAEEFNYPIAYGGLIENDKFVDKEIELQMQSYKIKTYRKTIKLLEDR